MAPLRACLLAAALLGLPGGYAWAAGNTPSINKITDVDAGAILPGATSGTVVLDSLAYPGGRRSATGGTLLGGSPSFTLGSLTLSGVPRHSWSISGSGSFGPLVGPGGATIAVNSVDFEPSSTNTGTFPASGTTSTFYLGVELGAGPSRYLPTGLYTGTFYLVCTDTTNGRSDLQSFTVTARVDPTPITLARLTGLTFGEVITGPTAGQVLLAPSGARSVTGGAVLGGASSVSAATFTVTGARNATYAITLPQSATLSGPGGSLTATAFTSSPAGVGTLGATGQQQLGVGATLTIPANQPDGDYAGTFTVVVAYN
jgi:hypothetical protein